MLDQVLDRAADRRGAAAYTLIMAITPLPHRTDPHPDRRRRLRRHVHRAAAADAGCAASCKAKRVEIIVVDPRSYMTYQPFLPEAAAGSVEPRHVVVPLRRVLDKCEVLTGRVVSLDHERRVARDPAHPRRARTTCPTRWSCWRPARSRAPCRSPGWPSRASGSSRSRRPSRCATRSSRSSTSRRASPTTPRAARCSRSCSSAAATPASRRWPSSRTWPRYATRYYPELSKGDIRFVLVEATGRILPEVGEDLGRYTVERAAQAQDRRPAGHPARVVRRRPRRALRRRRSSTPRRSSGPRASRPTRCSRAPACRSTTRAGCAAGRTCGSRASTAPGRPATARRCPT